MYRVEQQLNSMDRKLELLVNAINLLTVQQQRMMPQQQHVYQHAASFNAIPPAFESYQNQYHPTAAGMTAQQLHGLQLPAGPSQANTPVSSMQHQPLEDDV